MAGEATLVFPSAVTVIDTPAGWFADDIIPASALIQDGVNVLVEFPAPIFFSITIPAPPNGVTLDATGEPPCEGKYLFGD